MRREEPSKQISLARVGSARSVWTTVDFPQLTEACAFWVYNPQAPGCSVRELSKVGPGLSALPRSNLLRFRFSSTPQRHRLGWACLLYPSQVQEAQATRCLVSTLSQMRGASYHLPQSKPLSLLGAPQECHLRCAMCLLWGADLRL